MRHLKSTNDGDSDRIGGEALVKLVVLLRRTSWAPKAQSSTSLVTFSAIEVEPTQVCAKCEPHIHRHKQLVGLTQLLFEQFNRPHYGCHRYWRGQ